jgi:lysozyme
MGLKLKGKQELLKELGFYHGEIDGIDGPLTQGAMRSIRWALGRKVERVPVRVPVAQTAPMRVDQRALDLIKRFEGFRSQTYLDPVGIPTIGYGTTARAGVGIDPKPGMRITEADADGYMRKGLEKFAAQIRPMIKQPVTPAEFGAFLSLAYNIGPGAFRRSSALKHFNAGDKARAADAFRLWRYAGGRELPGLVKRREAERDLFLNS